MQEEWQVYGKTVSLKVAFEITFVQYFVKWFKRRFYHSHVTKVLKYLEEFAENVFD